ncbi:hypothetical protein FQ085_05690 [Planococcus sp. ANT_H30]|uniref:Permease n=1 Tax=Planococcus kocurii TaxID=1374 RepID=A0ABN4JT41_9BACL|nr:MULTISPECIES: hypothetical protein [Planococcus]ALS77416.1 hypothetical protein AUO94_01595 [Planococcus kocurii]KAA0959205.1 hypothetical protein FQ085_05690 [Planococcus sp. ANT_H30]
MNRFDMSFKNNRVRVYFATMIPLIIGAILLYLFLPNELQLIPTLMVIIGVITYYIWLILDRKKQKGGN